MKYLISIMFFFLFAACDKESASEKFKRECPYPNWKTNAHYLLLPVQITPNQLTYKLGDTIHIKVHFSDTMYDYNTEHYFVIQNFIFDVGVKLWRFENDSTCYNGFRENTFLIDSSYFQAYAFYEDNTDVMFVDLVEEDNMYKFRTPDLDFITY